MGETTWSHDNAAWQQTLDLARSYGWPAPRKATSHGGLLLCCPAGDERHKIRIYSTAKGTETVAIDLRKKVRNCPHRDVTEPVARIEGALTGAQRLLDAAENLLAAERADQRVQDLLDNLDDAEEELDQIETELYEASDQAEQAKDAVDASLRQRSPSNLADDAGRSLREAKMSLRSEVPKPHEIWQTLTDRRVALQERLDRLRHRIRAPSG